MQANSIICSGTSRFLNDTYTTNLHTNRIDITTGSNYATNLTPYVWQIISRQEEPIIGLIQNNSDGTQTTDQLWLHKDDIYMQATWDGTRSSLKEALSNKLSLSGGTMTGDIITPGNDSYGVKPATTNYGRIGTLDKRFYEMYASYLYATNGTKHLKLSNTDLVYAAKSGTTADTWDGTNTSLKTALGAKFNSAGGTISGAVSMSNNLTVSGSGSFNTGTVRTNSGAINFYRNPSQDVMTSAIQDTVNGLEIMIPTSRSTNIRVISSTGYINLLTKYGVGVYNEVGDGYKGITASNFTTASSRVVKKNIKDITVTDAKKILDLRPCTFDFKIGNEKNCAGMIAEEVMDVYPHLVSVPDNYDEEEAIEKTAKGELAQVPSLHYSKFVPYLIKMVQEQQKEIDELRERLTS